jgi:hypothetical protein
VENKGINPLATSTLDELIEEIGSRTTALLIVLEMPIRGDANRDEYGTQVRWKHAGPIGAIGMAEFAKMDIAQGLLGKRGAIES